MVLRNVALDDKYTLEAGRVFISGVQALVRLPIMQSQRDRAAGLDTAGFISGYRGSPLGVYDLSLWRASQFLARANIHFQPGLNEDLAATAVWGSQQAGLLPGAKYDGVFAIWYGKGPGVDRSGDPLRHGNLAGAAKNGGVLVVCGDDHPGKSSTTAHQSEHALAAHAMPVLYPSGVQEYLDLGLYGWALSRFSGLWVGFKCVNETVESTASVDVDPERAQIILPSDVEIPPKGVNVTFHFAPQEDDRILMRYKIPLAHAFARANRLDAVRIGTRGAKLGIVTAGKSYQDTMQALRLLGIDESRAKELGISVYKVAMIWPLEPMGLTRFAAGLEEVLFVEEKKPFLEDQAARILYNMEAVERPRLVGKTDEHGVRLLPADGQLDSNTVAQVIAARLKRLGLADRSIDERLKYIEKKITAAAAATGAKVVRMPYFCSGCPHNTSTQLPEGSFALSGIGCHTMALFMDRRTTPPTQMGGEGLNWTGIAPFTSTTHVFQNLGDGTYVHSGLLAIRAAVSAGVNVTYKILFNDAVAMTGGQPVEGQLTVADITRQVAAEKVKRIAVVTDEPRKYGARAEFASGVKIHHRDELDRLQREFREIPGTTIIIYDQTCAAEKRRRRKRDQYPDPPKRAFINHRVCEGCGDCSEKSNCVSILPRETQYGRKRQIDQSSCNKDFSCVKGFCPSFVTVHGGRLRRPQAASLPEEAFASLPDPKLPEIDGAYAVLVTGIGGTGVITVGAILGMAAHLEGKGTSVFDMTGLAQKGGAVLSHLRIAAEPENLPSGAIGVGEADLVLGCDLVVAGGTDALRTIEAGRTRTVINSHLVPTAAFQSDPDLDFGGREIIERIEQVSGATRTHVVDATGLASALTGNTIASNLFTVGFAYQKGGLPLSGEAIERAIELNGVAVEFNQRAFRLGRFAAFDPARVEALAGRRKNDKKRKGINGLDELIEDRVKFLTRYQDSDYAARYSRLVETVKEAERLKGKGKSGLTQGVARYYFKLLAYKDEYEVARLYTDGAFMTEIREQFEGNYKLKFHLAPPVLAKRDPETGELSKREFGPWMFTLFKMLAKLKFLRGTPLDPMGYTAERRLERQLIADYEKLIADIIGGLNPDNHSLAVELAEIPEHIRGFGHVKAHHIAEAKSREHQLLEAFKDPAQHQPAA